MVSSAAQYSKAAFAVGELIPAEVETHIRARIIPICCETSDGARTLLGYIWGYISSQCRMGGLRFEVWTALNMGFYQFRGVISHMLNKIDREAERPGNQKPLVSAGVLMFNDATAKPSYIAPHSTRITTIYASSAIKGAGVS